MLLAIKRFFTKSGSPVRPVYSLAIDVRSGAPELQQVGVENFHDYIQASAASCDISVIAARVAAGEVDLLNQRPGVFADVLNAPQTLAEVLQTRIDAKRIFDNLDPDVRSQFDSLEDFCNGAGDLPWLQKLGIKFDTNKVVNEVVKEVNADSES